MCFAKIKRRYNVWVSQKPMHPIWLEHKDKDIQTKYDLWMRHHLYNLIFVGNIVHWVYLVLGLAFNWGKSFSEQAIFICHIGSVCASLTIFLLLVKLRLSLIDYSMFYMMAVRITETFLILYFIEEGVSGFELVDKKEIYDAISFIATPTFFLACCNLRFNVFTTVPMTLFSTVYVM